MCLHLFLSAFLLCLELICWISAGAVLKLLSGVGAGGSILQQLLRRWFQEIFFWRWMLLFCWHLLCTAISVPHQLCILYESLWVPQKVTAVDEWSQNSRFIWVGRDLEVPLPVVSRDTQLHQCSEPRPYWVCLQVVQEATDAFSAGDEFFSLNFQE